MRRILKKIFILSCSLMLLGTGRKLPHYNVVLDPSRLSFKITSPTGPKSGDLKLLLDGKVIVSNSCGELSWAKHIRSEYTAVLRKAKAQERQVRLTGAKLCTLYDNDETIRIKVVKEADHPSLDE